MSAGGLDILCLPKFLELMQIPEGGYFFWVDVSALGTSTEVRDFLIHDANVGVSPGNWFGSNGEGYLRIMFSTLKDTSKYEEAMRRIKNASTNASTQRSMKYF